MKKAEWQNRIVGSGEEAPDQLLANPKNWRIHPQHQQQALEGVLDDVGWVQQVVVNRRNQTLIDGHLRVSLALRRNEPRVPVVYVDLSEAEEALILATLDPLAAMAATDAAQLDALLREVETTNEAVMQMLEDQAVKAGLIAGEPVDVSELWKGMPEFEQEDQSGIKCIVHFETEQDKAAFEALLGQKIPANTKSIWYPAKAWQDQEALRYVSE